MRLSTPAFSARAAQGGADVGALEDQIDARVFALYGLDEAEIALVTA